MNCPSCKTVQLSIAERAGVEIDFCPTCRGVWLDRGELDKIVAKAMADESGPGQPMPGGPQAMGGYAPQHPHPVPPTPYGHPPQRRYDDDNDDSKYGYKYTQPDPRTGQYPQQYPQHYQKPKKPFWKELFDF